MNSFDTTLRHLALAAVSVCSVTAFSPALAQDATFVLNSREAGAPTYNPIKGTKLNIANNRPLYGRKNLDTHKVSE